jgi:hypothetical protein
MPKTLDETYERALLEIDEDMRQDAQRLFQCLSVSIRPLRVEELAEILAIRFNAEIFPSLTPNGDWAMQRKLFYLCAPISSASLTSMVLKLSNFRTFP